MKGHYPQENAHAFHQKHFQMERLLWKMPEKKSLFAPQIKEKNHNKQTQIDRAMFSVFGWLLLLFSILLSLKLDLVVELSLGDVFAPLFTMDAYALAFPTLLSMNRIS